jgi:hypothetical protein
MTERHLPVQIRSYRVMDKEPQISKERRWPGAVLVFDTETSTDYSQRLHFGGYMLASVRYNRDGTISTRPVVEGIFADDELKLFYPDGFETLVKYMIDSSGQNRLADVWPSVPTENDQANGELDLAWSACRWLYAIDRTPFIRDYLRDAGHSRFMDSDRNYEPASIVGFNLPFDISRLAAGAGEARGSWDHGAVSLDFQIPYMPNVILKRMGAKGVDIHSTKAGNEKYSGICQCQHKRADHKPTGNPLDKSGALACVKCDGACTNYFDPNLAGNSTWLDVSNLVFALTARPHSLRSAGEAFGCRYLKTDAPDGHGKITPEYVDYLRNDVRATLDLWRAAMERFYRHPLRLPPERAYSPASLAKQYFRDMGIMGPLTRQDWVPASVARGFDLINDDKARTPFVRKSQLRKAGVILSHDSIGQPRFDPAVLARFIGAFMGGRSECRIRLEKLPVTLLDFKSMYPTIVALLGIWEMLTADRIEIVEVEPLKVQAFLAKLTIEDLLNPDTWPVLAGVADIQASGKDYLPIRSPYGANGSPGIGVNYLVTDQPVPYTLLDLAASKIHTGHVPLITRAWKIVASQERQPGLKPINFNGDPDLRLNPATDNMATRVIELRQIAQNKHEANRPRSQRQVKTIVDPDVPCRSAEFCPACDWKSTDFRTEDPPNGEEKHNHPEPCAACYRLIHHQMTMTGVRVSFNKPDTYDIWSEREYERCKAEIRRVHANDAISTDEIWNADTSKCRCDGCVSEFALKIFANAGFYGIFAEMNTPRRAKDNPSHGSVYDFTGQVTDNVKNPEEPGEFCFPPFASLITAGARLMLAMLEKMTGNAGGTHVFCDTDSLCVVASKEGGKVGNIPVLTYDQVEEIRLRFNSLNPYDRSVIPELLKREYPKKPSQPVSCVAISAKRYVIFRTDTKGNPILERIARLDDTENNAEDSDLVKRSEHGLGLYMNPLGDKCICLHERSEHARGSSGQLSCLSCECRRYKRYDWMGEAWKWIINRYILNRDVRELEWFAWPAIMRIPLTSWDMLHGFDKFNEGKPYSEQVKPWNFAVGYSVVPLARMLNPDMRLVSPFYSDISRWQDMPVLDIHNPDIGELKITTDSNWSDSQFYEGGLKAGDTVQVQSYGAMIREYVNHPEAKYDDADGVACKGTTRGQLYPTTVIASSYERIGKKSAQRLSAEVTLAKGSDHVRTYASDAESRVLDTVRLILRENYTPTELLRELETCMVKISIDTIKRFFSASVIPSSETVTILSNHAKRIARQQLELHNLLAKKRLGDAELFSMWRTARMRNLL